jgi:hypothetical protein
MLTHPVLEMPYRQEYYFDHAEDWGKVFNSLTARKIDLFHPYFN